MSEISAEENAKCGNIDVETADRLGVWLASLPSDDTCLKHKLKLNFREHYYNHRHLSFILLG